MYRIIAPANLLEDAHVHGYCGEPIAADREHSQAYVDIRSDEATAAMVFLKNKAAFRGQPEPKLERHMS